MHITEDVEELADALLGASRALVAIAARSLADVEEVTLPQWRALVVLAQPAPLTVGNVAEALAIHPSTATRLCDRLERKRLLRRQWGVSADRRETTVTLTSRGRRLVSRVMARRRQDLAAIAAAMPNDEREAAVDAMRSFAAAADALPVVDPFGWAGGVTDEDIEPATEL